MDGGVDFGFTVVSDFDVGCFVSFAFEVTPIPKDVKIEFYVIAAPRYSVEVSADNWKRAEELFERVCERVVANIIKAGGHGSFERKK